MFDSRISTRFLSLCCLIYLPMMTEGVSEVEIIRAWSYLIDTYKGPVVISVSFREVDEAFDYVVEWNEVTNGQIQVQSSDPLIPESWPFEYVIEDIFQGQCYEITVIARGNGFERNSSTVVEAYTALPYDVTFDANDIHANVSWKIQGNFFVRAYVMETYALDLNQTYTCEADNTSATSCSFDLLRGTLYYQIDLYSNSRPLCELNPYAFRGSTIIQYVTAPPTPVDVTLSSYEVRNQSVYLFVTYELSNSFSWFTYMVVLETSNGLNATYEKENRVTSSDPIKFNQIITTLQPTESYRATVQIVSIINHETQEIVKYGNISLPSNDVTTAPFAISIEAVKEYNRVLVIIWHKPYGGEAIDDYVITGRVDFEPDVEGFTSFIPHVVGSEYYEHATDKLVQGATYNVSIMVRNNAGNSSSPFVDVKIVGLPEPIFNITVTNLTTMRVDWLPMEDDSYYFLIEYESNNVFTTVFPNCSRCSYTIDGLIPYTEYTVYMFSVTSNIHGVEERSSTNPKTVLMFTKEFCDESNIQHPDGKIVRFPKTQAGYSNTSLDKCSDSTANEGTPLATRTCGINVAWIDPVWLSACEKTLEILASTNISSDDDRESVASDLTVLTSNATSLTSDDISHSETTLQSIVDTDHLYQNMTTLVIESIGNLLAAPEDEFEKSGIADSLLTTLNEVASIVILDDDEEFQSTSSTVALSVVQTSKKATNLSGIGYFEKTNPSSDDLGFSEGQFEIIDSNVTIRNKSSIWVPLEAVFKSKNARVSFYAFLDNKIFQVSNTSNSSNEVNIPANSPLQSNIILSASVNGSVVENLEENIKITFNYTKASCPSDPTTSSEECGDYLCGFWNELDSVWSRDGCTLIWISDDFVECQCNHLTNFATLFAYGRSESISNNFILDILTYIGSGISLIGTTLTIICLVIVRYSRKPAIPKQTIFVMINLAFALTLLNGFLLISFLEVIIKNPTSCSVIAVFLHFSLLTALLWTSVEAVYVCIGVVKPLYYRMELTYKKVCIASTLLGWGVPAIFVALSAAISFSSYEKKDVTSQICWIIPEMMLWLIIIPAAIILTLNAVVYIIVVKSYVTKKRVGNTANSQLTTGKSVTFSFSLFLMFGITWIFGFLLFDSNTANMVFAYIFTITNSLQGLFVFILFVIRNKRIRRTAIDKMKDVTSSGRTNNTYMTESKLPTSQ